MRLHRLEVEGFGPFRERQTVDFDAFAEDGIFLIGGRTGSGKSSILDAVCFGLYGGVPRYESGDKRLRSDHCAPEDLSEVVVEFSTTHGRFRVTRTPEYLRPAKRGGGLTKQAPTVLLEEWSGTSWEGRAARAVDVANELDEILQLSQGQFLQVILLAQNRFARFLLADSRERQALLRRLFATERFEDVQTRFEERRKASEQALGARLATVTARIEDAEGVVTVGGLWGSDTDGTVGEEPATSPTGSTQERIDALRRALARAEYRAERAQAERAEADQRATLADTALATVREEQKAQQERDRARAALARLDEESPRIAEARDELERARTAEALRATIAAVERAEQAQAAAVRGREAAREAWNEHGVELSEATAAALEQWAAELTRRSGGWEHAAELERQAPQLAAELRTAQDLVAELSARISADDAERGSLPARLQELTDERDAARRHGDRADDLDRERLRAEARLGAASEVARLTSEVERADRALADASRELAEAQATLADLRQRRLDGFAGELAGALIDAHACPVCGSLEHPAPAVHADPVSADDVTAAEAVRDAAAVAERSASTRCSELRSAVAAAAALAEGRTPDQAEAELAAAIQAHQQAAQAAEHATILHAQVAELTTRAETLERERAASAEALASAREALVVAEQRERDTQALIREARGDHESVAERLADAATRIAAARALAEAEHEHEHRAAALAEALQELNDTLAASVFEDLAEVQRALRTAAERDVLDARITAHAVQREKERGILLELELRTLPEEPIDVVPVEQAVADARAAWAAAVEQAANATSTAERLRELIETAAVEHARSAAQAADHEVLRGLADTIAGRGGNTHKMTLETFVLAAELEEIVTAANRRLNDMSAGRYQLRHSDALAARGATSGLGIVVDDAYTGQTRPAQSLSGGETFLSSLALALGLAEVVTARAGGIQLDTLFIDEGFGSLDAETLEVAMRTLDELRAGGRTVGVISHVEAMQEQIPAQLLVEQTDSGPSRIVPAR